MVRGMGRSYSRGGGRGSYRGSSSSNYHNSSSSRDDGGRDGGRSSYGHGGYGSSSGSSHRGIGSSSSGGGGGGGGGSSGTGRFGSSSGGHYESSSYNGGSRSTTSKYQSSSDRYGTSSSTSSRHNDDHKRPYKRSSRDRLSSDRKRSRTEGGSRRSLEYSSSGAGGGGGGGGGSSSNDYNSSRYDNGNNSYSSRRNDSHSTGGLGGGSSSSSSRRSPIHNMSSSSSSSRPSAPFRTQRDSGSSSHRSNERMGPPKSVAPRRFRGPITTSSSSTYRGRGSSLRGIRRPRGTMLRTSDLRLRRRFPLRTTNDTLHRIRLARLRSSSSSIKKRSSERTKKSWSHDAAAADGEKTPNASEKSDKTSIKDEKLDSSGGGAPAGLIGSDAGSTEKLTTTGENGGGGGGGTSTESPVKTKNSTKSTSSKVKTDETADDTNHNKERNNSHSIDGEQQHTKDADDIDKKRSDKDIISRYTPRKSTFIKLTCTHCRAKCLTFKEYTNHLYSRQHQVAIKRLSLRQRAQLTYMRQAQRNAQREIEDKIKDSDDQIAHFCLLCRLNYRSSKVDHQLSEAHRSMKKFLMPYCSVCRLVFKSPIIYETHRCSLDHIKRKARQELNNAASEEDERDLDLEQFMTVDSIGDVDENNVEMEDEIVAGGGGGGSGDTVANSGSEKTNDDSVGSNAGGGGSTTTHNNSSGSKTRTTEVNVGNEHVKKVEVYFCELCRYYLPKEEEFESALKNHCASRSHLRSYVRFKGNQNLRLAAEKIHRRHQEREAKKDKEAKPKVDSETTAEKSNATEETTTNTTASITASTTTIAIVTSEIDNQADEEKIADDKVWADVNKDLTELVQYTEANVDEEEDEESNKTTERYDRFKYSDKENDLDVSNKKDEINKVNVVVLKQQVVVAAAEVEEEEEEDEEEEEEQEEDEEEDDRVQLTNENSTEIDSNDNDVVKMNTE